MKIADLKALDEAATKGPWIPDGAAKVECKAYDICNMVLPYGSGKNHDECRANCHLTAAARNHLPAFLRLAEAAKELLTNAYKDGGIDLDKLEDALAELENVT